MTGAVVALPACQSRSDQSQQNGHTHVCDLFAANAKRGQRHAREVTGLYLTHSKNHLIDQSLKLLAAPTNECKLVNRIWAMFYSDAIATTEKRSALHIALHAPAQVKITVNRIDAVANMRAMPTRIGKYSNAVLSRHSRCHTGQRIHNVVCIGISGSEFWHVGVHEDLHHSSPRDITERFVPSVVGSSLIEATRDFEASEPLFIIWWKAFKTQETLVIDHVTRKWTVDRFGINLAVVHHFVAVSTNAQAVTQFGITPANMFGFWEWLDGHYAMDSAISLLALIAIGPQHFAELRARLHAIDEHFFHSTTEQDMPALPRLPVVWNNNFLDVAPAAVRSYDLCLKCFQAYRQQLMVERNGKPLTCNRQPGAFETAPVVLGQPSTNVQHSSNHSIHQSASLVPCYFVHLNQGLNPLGQQHDPLMANSFADSETRSFHFKQGVIFYAGSVDQWGVKLDKLPAHCLLPALDSKNTVPLAHYSSTNTLIARDPPQLRPDTATSLA